MLQRCRGLPGHADIFGDPVPVPALVDRFAHDTEMAGLHGEPCRPRGKKVLETMSAESAQITTGESCPVLDRR